MPDKISANHHKSIYVEGAPDPDPMVMISVTNGDTRESAATMTPENARTLADALMRYARIIDRTILPHEQQITALLDEAQETEIGILAICEAAELDPADALDGTKPPLLRIAELLIMQDVARFAAFKSGIGMARENGILIGRQQPAPQPLEKVVTVETPHGRKSISVDELDTGIPTKRTPKRKAKTTK